MKLPFDKIFCIHRKQDKSRFYSIVGNINFLGIEEQVEFVDPIQLPNMRNIASCLRQNKMFLWNGEGKGGALSLTVTTYELLRKCYEDENINNILIFEDDIIFSRNIEMIEDTINQIPNDYDILRIVWYEEGDDKFQNDLNHDVVFDEKYNKHWGTMMYALSKKGMKYIMDKMDTMVCVADFPLFDLDSKEKGIKNYFCTRRIAVHNYNIPTTIHK